MICNNLMLELKSLMISPLNTQVLIKLTLFMLGNIIFIENHRCHRFYQLESVNLNPRK